MNKSIVIATVMAAVRATMAANERTKCQRHTRNKHTGLKPFVCTHDTDTSCNMKYGI